jgi:type IX secretion system PorP/SprF family membrane protein
MLSTNAKSMLLLLYAFLLVGIGTTSTAQDVAFSQFYNNPIYLNPAFAGAHNNHRFALQYRNQWTDVSHAFKTYTVSYDAHVPKLGGGFGFLASHDISGSYALAKTTVGFAYSNGIKINRELNLNFGLHPKFVQWAIDWNSLTWSDQIDGRAGFVLQTQQPKVANFNFIDFSSGLILHSPTKQLGISVDHLVQPYANFLPNETSIKQRWTVHGSWSIPIRVYSGPSLVLKPNAMLIKSGPFTQFNVGISVEHQHVCFGLRYLQGEAVVLYVGVTKNRHQIGYSYDLNIHRIRAISIGSNEISYQFKIPQKKRRRTYKTIECQEF